MWICVGVKPDEVFLFLSHCFAVRCLWERYILHYSWLLFLQQWKDRNLSSSQFPDCIFFWKCWWKKENQWTGIKCQNETEILSPLKALWSHISDKPNRLFCNIVDKKLPHLSAIASTAGFFHCGGEKQWKLHLSSSPARRNCSSWDMVRAKVLSK